MPNETVTLTSQEVAGVAAVLRHFLSEDYLRDSYLGESPTLKVGPDRDRILVSALVKLERNGGADPSFQRALSEQL